MRVDDYFRSLSAELNAVKNRVRHMIGDKHWLTDGELKESVLRSVLRRGAARSLSIGRGFVVGDTKSTGQLDVLIHDESHPVLYRDGELVFATAASCRAIIEVKTNLSRSKYRSVCSELADTAELVRSEKIATRTMVGLFSYDANIHPEDAAEIASEVAKGKPARVVDHIALGDSVFLKYWARDPRRVGGRKVEGAYEMWHAYRLPQMAAGYFVHNFLVNLSETKERESDAVWFPTGGKEGGLEGRVALR